MLLKLTNHLLGVDVVNTNGSMVCDTAECFLYEVGKLYLVNAARVGITISMNLRIFRNVLRHIGSIFSINWVENRVCFVQVDNTPLITRSQALII